MNIDRPGVSDASSQGSLFRYVAVFDHPHGNFFFFQISNLNLPDAALCHATHPVTSCQAEETGTLLSASPSQVVLIDSGEVTFQHLLLQTGQHKPPRPVITGHAYQPLCQLCCPPLDIFQVLNILFALWSPELYTVFNVRLHNDLL